MKLEAVVIPVSDVDRAKKFYRSLGGRLDADFRFENGFRVVQYTPRGSGGAIQFGSKITTKSGSADGLYLVVSVIESARNEPSTCGLEVSEVFHAEEPGAQFEAGSTDARIAGPAPDHASYRSFTTFRDPDRNRWLIQEVTTRLPGRATGTTTYTSAADLSKTLQRAAFAHGEHEKRIGQADPKWPDWYAEYMVREQSGETPPQ